MDGKGTYLQRRLDTSTFLETSFFRRIAAITTLGPRLDASHTLAFTLRFGSWLRRRGALSNFFCNDLTAGLELGTHTAALVVAV
jgi:hypothetical protein